MLKQNKRTCHNSKEQNAWGGKRSTLQWGLNHKLINTCFCLYLLVWFIHMHASLPNCNNIHLLPSFIMRRSIKCQTLNSENSARAVSKWHSYFLKELSETLPQRPLFGRTQMFCVFPPKQAAELFSGLVHFATGLTEVSFLHHGVRKRWNITGSEVQFLGNAAVAKVKFLAAVTAELQLLEPG